MSKVVAIRAFADTVSTDGPAIAYLTIAGALRDAANALEAAEQRAARAEEFGDAVMAQLGIDGTDVDPHQAIAALQDERDSLTAALGEKDKIREAAQAVLNDEALRCVAGWYDSIKRLEAALTAPSAGMEDKNG